MAEPLTKKIRLWNPAIDDMSKEDLPSSNDPSPQPIDFSQVSKPHQPPLPMFFQNYMHIAPLMMRMQQQQMEQALMRQRFLSMAQARAPAAVIPQPVEVSPPISNSSGQSPTINPLVANALGVQAPSENCCAVCGAQFRLTGDLVTHMRNNHRRTRFKRKNEKPVE